ncbi:hypothetical protein BX616_005496 [Lobosporangium transversale]|uniref:Uncharacterized protein n=1 Tax=Lobosporangium transversale TaxID=64571 RepID=A0A1Y2GUG2_9FUNG|nr:hypothetical protein BCR41DRAFT_248178 [Lobosporangium transversale]KAF9897502.1 hypothetical protein BX616_005496 [Lobosporangium transversale]ORZ23858.1 hypothetical protein BCR41DRAFT_248178 [Lobosporangium transversale]|eukprot:XP_021883672.1 hypothetical protein BCR41DRAFT_248178 [Lobosporangium transversale]
MELSPQKYAWMPSILRLSKPSRPQESSSWIMRLSKHHRMYKMTSNKHTDLRLPPYTLQLNAAEWVFGKIKTHVRPQDLHDWETLTDHINNSILSITSGMCWWIREAAEVNPWVAF